MNQAFSRKFFRSSTRARNAGLSPARAFRLLSVSLLFCLLLCAPQTSFLTGASPRALAATPSLDEDDDYLNNFSPVIADPLEPWNRAMFRFNDVLLDKLARPVYRGYEYVTPQFLRTGIHNFFYNLAFPIRFTNNLLQGKGRAAGVEMSRFVLNTTAGLGGFFDVAQHHKPIVPVSDEDLGQTLGVWGIGEGCYLVWPVLGPSTARDTVGMVGDTFLDPVTYVSPWELSVGISVGRAFNDLDSVLDMYDELKRSSVEPYTSARDAYVQHRRAKVAK